MEIEKISDNVWKFTGADKVNCYLLDIGESIMIDAGNRADHQELLRFLGNLTDLSKVSRVIFTHLHYDHTGNFDLFPNAEFFASKQEIEDFEKSKEDSILSKDLVEKFDRKLKHLPEKIGPLEVISTPGHTRGSVCIWYGEKKILFSGDTVFPNNQLGRTDLPNSAPSEMNSSLIKLLNYNFKILAPGHDY